MTDFLIKTVSLLVLVNVWFGNYAETIDAVAYPGDVVTKINQPTDGYLIRLVSSTYHVPSALVVWPVVDNITDEISYETSWENHNELTLVSRSESSNYLEDEFECNTLYFYDTSSYLTYMIENLKVGMLVRYLVATSETWKGDLCVKIGDAKLTNTTARLWCYRQRQHLTHVETNLTLIQIIGVTNYPAKYEYMVDGELMGLFLRPMVSDITLEIERTQVYMGLPISATFSLKCANQQASIAVDYNIIDGEGYTTLGGVIVDNYSVTKTWTPSTTGHNYVKFKVSGSHVEDIGAWYEVIVPVTHSITIFGSPDEDNRYVYADTSFRADQRVTGGTNGSLSFIDVSFNVNTSSNLDEYSFNVTHDKRGLYETYSIGWNALSIDIITVSIVSVKHFPVTDISLTSDKTVAKPNDTVQFTLSASGGYGSTCVIDFGNGTTELLTLNYTTLLDWFPEQDPNITVHTDGILQQNFTKYFVVGRYTVNVTCNGDGIILVSAAVDIEEEIVGLSCPVISTPMVFGSPINVPWSMITGTDVTFNVSYNGVPCCPSSVSTDSGSSCMCLITDRNLFDQDGVVDINITAANGVSNDHCSLEVIVVEPVELTELTLHATAPSMVESLHTKFPTEHPVLFRANYTGMGISFITWRITCPLNGSFELTCSSSSGGLWASQCGSNEPYFLEYQYQFPDIHQTCEVYVWLQNTVSNTSITAQPNLFQSIVYTSMSNDGPGAIDKVVSITITLDQLGTGTCLVVDFADNSPLRVYSTWDYCESNVSAIHPNSEKNIIFVTPSTQSIVVNHVYRVLGVFDVQISVTNDVSMASDATQIIVLEKFCAYPNVTIQGLPVNSSNTLQAPQVYKSLAVELTAEIGIDCEITELTEINWIIKQFDEDPRISNTPDDISMTMYSLSDDLDLHSPELDIPAKTLEYGFYEITVRVNMLNLSAVFAEDKFYLQTTPTPWLQPDVIAGPFIEQYFREKASLDGSPSVDPDYHGAEGQVGCSYLWFCRDLEDHVQFDFPNEQLQHIPHGNETFPPANKNSTGCFGTGRGRLNATDIVLDLETQFMVEGKSFFLTLMMTKPHPDGGLRIGKTDIYFDLLLGKPPKLSVSCDKNCLSKVRTDEKVIVKSECTKLCYGELEFCWSLYIYDDLDQAEPYNVSTLTKVPQEQFMDMVSNPTNELDIAIKPHSLQRGKKYLLQVKATRPNQVYGEKRFTLLMDKPPVNGNCSASPSSGIALVTFFNIICSNWTDEDPPLNYVFSYTIKQQSKITFSSRTDVHENVVNIASKMPMGDAENNNELAISIDISDKFGEKTTIPVIIQVSFPGPEDLDLASFQESLVSDLETMRKADQDEEVIRLAINIGLVLNNLGEASSANKSSLAINEQQIDEIKRTLLSTLSEIETKDFETLSLISGAMQVLTDNSEELSEVSQDLLLSILNNTMTSLLNATENGVGFQSASLVTKNIANSVAQLLLVTSATTYKNETKEPSRERTMNAMYILPQLHDVILNYLVANEGPATLVLEHVALQTEKVTLMKLGENPNQVAGCSFNLPNAIVFGYGDVVQNVNDTISQLATVSLKMLVLLQNPYTWDNSSKTVHSDLANFEIDFPLAQGSTDNLTEEIEIAIARDPSQFPQDQWFFFKPDIEDPDDVSAGKPYLKYHCFNRTNNWTSLNFELRPEDVGLNITVYLKTGAKPDIESGDYDEMFHLPNFTYCNLSPLDDANVEAIVVDPDAHCQVHPYTLFLSNQVFNTTGKHCFAIKTRRNMTEEEQSTDDVNNPTSRRKRSFACDVGQRRMRRSCVLIPTPPPTPAPQLPFKVVSADNLGFDGKFFFPNQTPNYNLTMFESSCLYWDEVNETFAGHGCRVGYLTSRSSIQCFCKHLTSFGSDLLVAPNPIDFDKVFANFGSLSNNVAVLALMSTIIGLYILGVVWARRADKRDILMTGPTILRSRHGTYRYLVTLFTGNRFDSGTTASVFLKINGNERETFAVKLSDRHRPTFERAQENAFVVSYEEAVGDITSVEIWHNNKGISPSWYLSRLSIKSLETEEQWYFICDNWLAVESDDGKVCRILPAATDEDLTNFNQLFTARTVKGLADGHLWFSIFSRPANSNFTRVQRMSCCLCLLCCTMITSAMFYNIGGEAPSPYTINIGSLEIDLKGFIVGLQSSIIIIPVNVLLVQIFRNLRPKKSKKKENTKKSGSDSDLEDIRAEKEVAVVGLTEEAPPPPGRLPHWFLYIAYMICYLTSAACIFFTLLYSIQWGEKLSTEWVIAMVTAFLQSVFLLQPIKVIFMAIVFALIIKKPCDSDDQPAEVEINEGPEPAMKEVEEGQKKERKKRKKVKKVKIYSPPDADTLLKARVIRLKEIKMNAVLIEIATFFVFLGMLMNVANYHRDPDTFLLTKTLYETFDEVDAYGVDFGVISDGDSLWMWARETLIPNLYATEWYNGEKVKKGYISNMEDYLVGVPRIRQIRIEKDSCEVEDTYFKDSIPHCYSSYSMADEETGVYNVAWKPLTSGSSRRRRSTEEPGNEKEWLSLLREREGILIKNVREKRALDPISSASSGRNRRRKNRLVTSASPKVYTIRNSALLPNGDVMSCLDRWHHKTTVDLRGFPYWGSLALYSGGGYPANLGYDTVTAYTVVSDLHSHSWIDVQTRAVLVEFTVYNANTNLFGIVSMFIEFPASSGVFVTAQYQASRFYLHLSFSETLAHVMVIFFMLYFLYREGKLLRKERCSYFKGFWNWIEVILIICEFFTIIFFLARLYEVDRNLLQLRENPNDYVGFQYAGSADAALVYVLGALVFFYNLRFLRLLRFNVTFLILGKTMRRLSVPIINFCIPFFFGFIAFGLYAFSVFGSELEDYSTFTMTMVTQFSMTLGDFDFESLVMVSPVIGPLYFLAFIALNVIVLMNVFLAIINDSYAEIQEEEQDAENEYEIIDYVSKKLKEILQSNSKKKHKKRKRRRRKKRKEESEVDKMFSSMEDCGERLSNLIDVIEQSINEEEQNEKAVVAVPEEKRNDMCYRILLIMETCDDDDDSDDDDDVSTDDEENGELADDSDDGVSM